MPDTPQSQLEKAGGITAALLDTLDQLVDRVLGKQTVDKDGKPLRQVAYMHMPNGLPIDPRQYANPWTPAGGKALHEMQKDGTLPKVEPAPAPAPAAPGAPPVTPVKPEQDQQLMASMQAALNTAWLFDEMPMVTGDGTFRPYPSTRKLSSAYEGLVHTVQAVPPPPQSPEVVKALEAAEKVLYNLDADGNITGPTIKFQNYLKFSQAYADAKANFAREQSIAMTDPVFGAAWPVTAASLQQKVDNAYDIWRSSGADDVEKALDTMNSAGRLGGRALRLAGARAARQVGPLAVRRRVGPHALHADHAARLVRPHQQRHRLHGDHRVVVELPRQGRRAELELRQQLVQGLERVDAGERARRLPRDQHRRLRRELVLGQLERRPPGRPVLEPCTRTGPPRPRSRASTASIKIERPWCLTELLHIGGWYVPGDKAGCVSDGTIAGQEGDDDKLLPMITTQALVIRNVTITATGWGSARPGARQPLRRPAGPGQQQLVERRRQRRVHGLRRLGQPLGERVGRIAVQRRRRELGLRVRLVQRQRHAHHQGLADRRLRRRDRRAQPAHRRPRASTRTRTRTATPRRNGDASGNGIAVGEPHPAAAGGATNGAAANGDGDGATTPATPAPAAGTNG